MRRALSSLLLALALLSFATPLLQPAAPAHADEWCSNC